MTLHQIIKSLQAASGSNAKLAILQANKDNELLKTFLKATYDPSISYYQSKISVPKYLIGKVGEHELSSKDVLELVDRIAGRKATGDKAKELLAKGYAYLNKEGQELLELLIKRSVGSGVGDTMILKAFPNLYFIPPYMRCSLMDSKIAKHFNFLKRIIVQKKADGSFVYVQKASEGPSKAFTRAGTHYPSWFVERLLIKAPNANYVLSGELLVTEHSKHGNTELDRQTGNGILNSILSGEDEETFDKYSFTMEAWDCVDTAEFIAGISITTYDVRLDDLKHIVSCTPNIIAIETNYVSNIKEAYAHYSRYLQEGFEGAVVKDPSSPWKDHTSPYNVKLKIQFEAEYKITGCFEGTKKYAGMLGGFHMGSSDDLILFDVGTGFTDKMRKDFWEMHMKNPSCFDGSVATIKANDVISNRSDNVKSLFLPVFSEIRIDKTEADTLERVMAQLEAAKSGEPL